MNEFLVDDAALGRVRAGVMGRVRRRKRARVAAVVLALVIGVSAVREPEVERMSLTMPAAPAAPEWVPVRPVAAAVPVVMATAAGRPAARITIFTDDPNVVIVLVGEGGAE